MLFIVDGSSTTSSKVTSRSGMSSFSPVQPGSAMGPPSLGILTWLAESKILGPEARNVDAASSGWTRMR